MNYLPITAGKLIAVLRELNPEAVVGMCQYGGDIVRDASGIGSIYEVTDGPKQGMLLLCQADTSLLFVGDSDKNNPSLVKLGGGYYGHHAHKVWSAAIRDNVLALVCDVINANAFCQLGRDSDLVHRLRDVLVEKGVLRRADKPHTGCVALTREVGPKDLG